MTNVNKLAAGFKPALSNLNTAKHARTPSVSATEVGGCRLGSFPRLLAARGVLALAGRCVSLVLLAHLLELGFGPFEMVLIATAPLGQAAD